MLRWAESQECLLLIPALPDEATARLLTTASQHLQDVPRLWL